MHRLTTTSAPRRLGSSPSATDAPVHPPRPWRKAPGPSASWRRRRGIHQNNVSAHVRVLARAGLVTSVMCGVHREVFDRLREGEEGRDRVQPPVGAEGRDPARLSAG